MKVEEEIGTSLSEKKIFYDNFWKIWWNLLEWSTIYFLLALIVATFHLNPQPVRRVLLGLTDVWPTILLLSIIAILIFVDRVALRRRSARWQTVTTRIRERKLEASGAVMSLGSIIFVMSDLYFHSVIPIVVSVPLWWSALLLQQSSTDRHTKVEQSTKFDEREDL